MKTNTLELVFILDKSGSMQPLTDDTIGGFNSNIEKHKDSECNVLVTTVLFDNESQIIHDRIPISDVPQLTRKEYAAGGCTALYDAVGSTISHIDDIHRYIRKEDIPNAVLFVIITDGLENASREYFGDQVRSMVEEKKSAGWDFVFLGAGIDAREGASKIGIGHRTARQFHHSAEGIEDLLVTTSDCIAYSEMKAQGCANYESIDEFMDSEVEDLPF